MRPAKPSLILRATLTHDAPAHPTRLYPLTPRLSQCVLRYAAHTAPIAPFPPCGVRSAHIYLPPRRSRAPLRAAALSHPPAYKRWPLRPCHRLATSRCDAPRPVSSHRNAAPMLLATQIARITHCVPCRRAFHSYLVPRDPPGLRSRSAQIAHCAPPHYVRPNRNSLHSSPRAHVKATVAACYAAPRRMPSRVCPGPRTPVSAPRGTRGHGYAITASRDGRRPLQHPLSP